MSAFLCSDRHTFALALWSVRQDTDAPQTADVIALAKRLRRLNNYALRCRYGDVPEYLPRDPMPALANATTWLESASAADVAQSAHCLQYQCSEGDTDVNAASRRIRRAVRTLQRIVQRADAKAAGAKSEVWSI